MSLLVVDSSIVIKWLVPEHDSALATSIYREFQAGNLTLIAPELLLTEIGNIVWKKLQRQLLTVNEAGNIIGDVLSLPVTICSDRYLLSNAFDLAILHQRTVYDMLYVALAVREKCSFVMADERLVNCVSAAIPAVKALASWP